MSAPVSLSKAEMTLLVDKCTDGALTADEAEVLSVALRRDDDTSQWILNELELAGLISEAFCKTKVEDFVRGFCERLAAEAAPDAFTSDTQRMIARDGEPPRPATPKARLLNAFFMPGQSGAARSKRPAATRGRPRYRRFAVAGLVVLAMGAAVWGMMRGARTATLVSASGNVVLLRDGKRLPPRPGTRLVVGDSFIVPASGSAALSFDKMTVAHVAEQSEAAIAESCPRSSDGVATRQLELTRGSIIVDVGSTRRGHGLIVRTPHAAIDAGKSRYTVGVTLSSTQLSVKMGCVTLIRGGGSSLLTLTAGESTIVGKRESLRTDGKHEKNEGWELGARR
jgi:ferric-dicitrate binding protein FerR (iron transport regulator)